MVLEFMDAAALTLPGVAFVAGLCGLRMCRAMLTSPNAGDLRRAADMKTQLLANCSSLSSRQQEAVLRALHVSADTHDV